MDVNEQMAEADAVTHLRALIDEYWELAYAEGKEGRKTDTPNGDAQRVRNLIEKCLSAIAAYDSSKREQQAQAVDVGAIREVIESIRGVDGNINLEAHFGWARKLERALTTQQAPSAEPVVYFIGGPSSTAWVWQRDEIEKVIADLCRAYGDDPDDYTVTALYNTPPPSGSSNTHNARRGGST